MKQKDLKKKGIAMLLAATMIATMIPHYSMTVQAKDTKYAENADNNVKAKSTKKVGGKNVNVKEKTTYDISKGNVTITQSGDYHITGSSINQNVIRVENGAVANITLDNVTILKQGSERVSVMSIVEGSKVTLTVTGKNELCKFEGENHSGSGNGAGIFVDKGSTLTIEGDGNLLVKGGRAAAGIGAQNEGATTQDNSCGSITINSGHLIIVGVGGGAPIGLRSEGTIDGITINGGNIQLYTSEPNANNAIGGYRGNGASSAKYDITINGGSITANSDIVAVRGGKVIINGGSIDVTDVSPTPVNKDGDELQKVVIPNDQIIKSVTVNGSDYKVSTDHSGNIMLYLPKKSGSDVKYEIKITDNNNKETIHNAVVSGDAGNETIRLENELYTSGIPTDRKWVWTHGETAPQFEITAKYGKVQLEYSTSETGGYSANQPTQAGNYFLKASVKETSEYSGAEKIIPFEIRVKSSLQEGVDYTIPKGLSGQYSSNIGTVDLSAFNNDKGTWSWVNSNEKIQLGTHSYEAVFTPKDIDNYLVAKVQITVEGKKGLVVKEGVENTDYTYENGVLTFIKNGNYTVANAVGMDNTSDRIVIPEDFEGTLTLNDVSINLNDTPCIDVHGTAKLKILFNGTNILGTHMGDSAAIQFVNVTTGELRIDSQDPNAILNVHGRNGPGIGSPGNNSGYTKNLYIDGGKIEATSSDGIGIGSYATEGQSPSEITINGGIITGDIIGSSAKGTKIKINGGSIGNRTIKGNVTVDKGFIAGNIVDEDGIIKDSNGNTLYRVELNLIEKNVDSMTVNGENYINDIQETFGQNPIYLYLKEGTYTVNTTDKAQKNYTYTIKVGSGGQGTSKVENRWIENVSMEGWVYGKTANDPKGLALQGTVEFTYASERDGTYTSKKPTNAGTYYVKATVKETTSYTGLESIVTFTIAKADTELAFKDKNIDKVYDKNPISEPSVTKTGSSNDVVLSWYIADGNGWKKIDSAPSDAGRYKVVASVVEDANYNGTNIEKEFSIKIADNEWTKELSIENWTYNENASKPSAQAQFGEVVFTYSDKEDGTYTEKVPTEAGTYYVKATVKGTENYTGLEKMVSFKIEKATSSVKFKDDVSFDKVYDKNVVTVTEEHIEKTGSTGAVQFMFEKKVNDQWQTVNAPTEVGVYRVTAMLSGDNNYTLATSNPLELTISKADSQVTITTPSLDKKYDGNAVSNPAYTTSGSDGTVTIKWQENTGTADSPKWEDLKSIPSKVGSYRVVVELEGNENYNSASATLEFVISKTKNSWVDELAIDNWTYGQTAKTPNAQAQFGEVVFTYSDKEDGTYTSEKPTNAGTYYVKATVKGTENYTGLEKVVSFKIKKAVPTPDKLIGLVLEQGKSLSEIELPKQFEWVDETIIVDELGKHTFKAIYTPEDTTNYETMEVEIEIEVVPTPIVFNHVPTMSVSDKTITVGDKFDPLKDATANDNEDGDLTSKIKVIKNTVDTEKAGIYEVIYQVTDSQGASVIKTINVTVKDKTVSVNPDQDKSDSDKDNSNVETGDSSYLLWEVLLAGSGIILIYSLYRKKREIN